MGGGLESGSGGFESGSGVSPLMGVGAEAGRLCHFA